MLKAGSVTTRLISVFSNKTISSKWLSVNLFKEADGLIGRKAYPEIPPRVEYSLTPRGLSLIPYLEGLVGWALANMPQIMNEREEKVV